MAIDTPARHIYSGDGSTRVFPIPTYIQGDDYIRIEINGVHQSDRSKWDIVNNSIIFVTAPIIASTVDVQVATSVEALAELGNTTNVDLVANSIDVINTVGSNISNINIVGTNIDKIITVGSDLIEAISEIDLVAANINNVNNVSNNVTRVASVGDNITKVIAVADDLLEPISEINIVATSINNVNNVGNNIASVNNVGSNISNIISVKDNSTNINTVATNINNVNNVVNNITNVNNVSTDIAKGYRSYITNLFPNGVHSAIRFTLLNGTTISVSISSTNNSNWVSTIQTNASYIANVKNTLLSLSLEGTLVLNDKSSTELSNVKNVEKFQTLNSSWILDTFWDSVSAIIRVSDNLQTIQDVSNYMLSKQDILVSGTNIKTINNISLLGAGNIDLVGSGFGDMSKDVYDTNNSGVVDNAELVNGYIVEKSVPVDAIFTDTVYDDAELRDRIETLELTDYVVDAGYVHTDNNFTNILKTKLDNVANGAEVNVNPDWNATTGDAVILNKPNSITGYGITDVYVKFEIDDMIGDINSALDTINGEVI